MVLQNCVIPKIASRPVFVLAFSWEHQFSSENTKNCKFYMVRTLQELKITCIHMEWEHQIGMRFQTLVKTYQKLFSCLLWLYINLCWPNNIIIIVTTTTRDSFNKILYGCFNARDQIFIFEGYLNTLPWVLHHLLERNAIIVSPPQYYQKIHWI